MKIIKYLLIFTLIAVAGIVIAALTTQSTDYDLNQSLVINSSPENVSEYVSDLKTWSTWG